MQDATHAVDTAANETKRLEIGRFCQTVDADVIQREIDLAYHNMMVARTETGERFWCDRLKYYAQLKKAQGGNSKGL